VRVTRIAYRVEEHFFGKKNVETCVAGFSGLGRTEVKFERRPHPVSTRTSHRCRCNASLLLLLPMLLPILEQRVGAQTAPVVAPQTGALRPYLMDRDAEIALAQSAAPPSISHSAAVLVLTAQGYEYASKGTNGFECLVQRGWMNDLEDSDYGSAALRSPMCLNPAAVRMYLPLINRRTTLARGLASRTVVKATIDAEFAAGSVKANEQGAMCYMMSKDGFFGSGGHPIPHIMFFVPTVPLSDWAANQPGSPIFGYEDSLDHLSVFILPSGSWSDGSPASPGSTHTNSLVVHPSTSHALARNSESSESGT
jgi:hypothetical protein